MALWLMRAGKHGEFESKFFDNNRIYLTWSDFSASDRTGIQDYEEVKRQVNEFYGDEPKGKLRNWSKHISTFLIGMQVGDWVVLPRKRNATIAIGEITSECKFDPSAPNDSRNYREVKWLNTDIPRSNFDQDLLFSFGAFLTICQIKRNDAEERVRAMANNEWQVPGKKSIQSVDGTFISTSGIDDESDDNDENSSDIDLEQLAKDSIAKPITRKFKGHGLARIVEAILQAQGFTTYLSPEGPDKGVDILAGSGSFGFGHPKICVQVKSGDVPADHPQFTHMIGAMQSVQADYGLFVSWSDFKHTVAKEEASKFFKVHLWNQNDLIEQLLKNYDNLDQDIKAEIPLKKIWIIPSAELDD